MNTESRVELHSGKRGTTTVKIICATTKQIVPVYGLERQGAVTLAQLLVDLQKAGMDLPKHILKVESQRDDSN